MLKKERARERKEINRLKIYTRYHIKSLYYMYLQNKKYKFIYILLDVFEAIGYWYLLIAALNSGVSILWVGYYYKRWMIMKLLSFC